MTSIAHVRYNEHSGSTVILSVNNGIVSSYGALMGKEG